MACDRIFQVGTLTNQESWVFFREIAGEEVENSDISPVARVVAAKCGGLPTAIVTLARALRNQNKYVWNDAARQLKQSTPENIEGMQGTLFSSLELSYNHLKSKEAKSLFLFCSLFPEDFSIPVELLVRYGMGLRWFNDIETMEAVQDRAHAIVSTLTSSFLLIADDKSSSEEFVKMHDVIRDFALMIAPKSNNTFLAKAGINLQEWPNRDRYDDLTSISLMGNNIKSVPAGLNCSKLQSLLLQKNSELAIPSNFFEGMKDLKVLDLSGTKILPLPESISLLTNLRTLHLNNCNLDNLSLIGQLMNLEILSFRGSENVEIPMSFSQLGNLRFLDLEKCHELKLISHGVIPCLHKLEELYMTSFTDWDYKGEGDSTTNINLFELQGLSYLTTLHIYIPNPNIIPDKMMSFQKLTSFTVHIGHAYNYPSSLYSRKMGFSRMSLSKIFDSWVKSLLEKTYDLFLIEIRDFDLGKVHYNNLKSLEIKNCEIKYLQNTLGWAPNLTFHNLEKLNMYGNSKLVGICHGQPPAQSFSKLKDLEVQSCSSLSIIVPSHLLQRFQSLQRLKVRECESVVYIFDCEGLKIENGETKLLSSLEDIYLSDLPRMTHVWNGDTKFINLRDLKSITVKKCSDLKEIFFLSPAGLLNLIHIEISRCHKLKKLFTPSILQSLVKLRRLELEDCSAIEEIITNEEGAEKEESTVRITLPSLSELTLAYLDNLTCFSSSSYSIEYPTLETLRIKGCSKMKTFGCGDQLTPKLKNVQIPKYKGSSIDAEFRWMGNLNATVEQLFKEQGKKKTMTKAQDEKERRTYFHPIISIIAGLFIAGVRALHRSDLKAVDNQEGEQC